MDGENQTLTYHLQKHVQQLAGDIGERNVFAPEAVPTAN
jgi:hypothetical protein